MDTNQRSLLIALSGPRGSGKKTHTEFLAQAIRNKEKDVVIVRIAPTLYPTTTASRNTLMPIFSEAYRNFVREYNDVIIPALGRQNTIVICRGYVADFFARYAVITGTIPFEQKLNAFFDRYPVLGSAVKADLTFWFDVHRATYRAWQQRVNDRAEFEKNEKDFLLAKTAYDDFFGEVSPSRKTRLYQEEFSDQETVDMVIDQATRAFINTQQE